MQVTSLFIEQTKWNSLSFQLTVCICMRQRLVRVCWTFGRVWGTGDVDVDVVLGFVSDSFTDYMQILFSKLSILSIFTVHLQLSPRLVRLYVVSTRKSLSRSMNSWHALTHQWLGRDECTGNKVIGILQNPSKPKQVLNKAPLPTIWHHSWLIRTACLFCSFPCMVCLAGAVSQAIPILKRKGLAWRWPRTISCSAFRGERCGKDLARATWSQMGDFQRKHLTAQLLLGLLSSGNCNALTHATSRDAASWVMFLKLL